MNSLPPLPNCFAGRRPPRPVTSSDSESIVFRPLTTAPEFFIRFHPDRTLRKYLAHHNYQALVRPSTGTVADFGGSRDGWPISSASGDRRWRPFAAFDPSGGWPRTVSRAFPPAPHPPHISRRRLNVFSKVANFRLWRSVDRTHNTICLRPPGR